MKMRTYLVALAVVAFGVVGTAAPAGASTSCVKNPLPCVNGVVCFVAAQAELQCFD